MSDIEQAFRDGIVQTVVDLGDDITISFPGTVTYPDDFLYDEDDPGPEPYDDYDEPDYVAEEVD